MRDALSGLAVAVLLAATVHGCSLTQHHKDSLEYRTRFFENLMGLDRVAGASIVFVAAEDMDGYCGRVGWRPRITEKGLGYEGPVIWYSLDLECDTFETALHEVCHLRWKHHRMDLETDAKESEVQDCVRAYKAKLKAVGRHRSALQGQ